MALAALAFLFVAVLPLTGRYATYAVLSGSMEPSISIGSLAVAVPADPADLHIGDVISYTALQPDHPSVTHRIVSIDQTNDGLVFKTKGDANGQEDAWQVRYSRLAGRVVGAVPLLGYVIVGATQPAVRTGLAAALLVVLSVLWLRLVLRAPFARAWPRCADTRARWLPAWA